MVFAGTASYFGVTSVKKSKEIKKLEDKIEVLQKQGNKNENFRYSISKIKGVYTS